MARNHRNGEPAYKRIQNSIRVRLKAGELKPGDLVDSERSLARTHRVSLMTARHALADLAREGVVERRHGAGTFVATPKIHFNKLMSYTEQMASRGLTARSRVVSCSTIASEPEIAARLAIAAAGKLFRVERVRQAGDEPFALETCYLSADDFSGLNGNRLERGSLFAALENDYSTVIAYADEEIDATDADAKTADLLKVARGTPLLRTRQLIYSSSGKPTIYAVGLYLSGRHTMLIRRFR